MAKEGLKKVPNYLKNVTKSTAYAAMDVFKELTPSFTETMSTNADLVMDISNDIRNYKNSIKSTKQKLESSDIGQATKAYKKNLMDDLKTGKLYNKERDAEYVMKASGFDKIFSMDDMDFDDLDFDSDDTGVNKAITVNSLASTKANVETMYGVANSLGSIAINNTDYIVENQKNLNTMNMMTNYKFFDEINTRLADISSNVKGLLDYANGNVTAYFDKTLKYYDETVTQTNKIIALNQEYTELFRNMYGKKDTNSSTEKDYHGDILNSGFNAKEYAKYVAHNFKQTYQTNFGGMMNIMGEDSNPFLALAGSPLKFLPKMIAKKVVSKDLQKSLGGFDSTFKNFFSSLLLKTSSESSKVTGESNPLREFLAEHFGLKPEYEGSIDPGKYVKGTIPFDGMTKQAIIEVIPTYLRKILSAVSGNDEKVYNYSIGKFVTSRNLEKDLNTKIDNSYDGFNSKYDIHNQFEKLGLQDKERDVLDKDLNKFYKFLTDNSFFFNPHKESYDDLTFNGLSLDGGEGSFNSIVSALLSLPKEKIMELNSDVYQVKKNRKFAVNDINKELSPTGMGALKNNSDINDSVGKMATSTDISKIVDSYDKSVFDYLRDIRTILLEGIKTYTFDVGKISYKRNRTKMGTYDNLDDRLQRYKDEARSFRENIPENISHLKEQKGLTINDLTNMGAEKIKDKMNPKKKTDLKEPMNELIKDTRLSGTLNQIKDYTDSIIKSPAKLATSVVSEVDKKMYELIYGKGTGEEDQKYKGSFFSAILETVKQKITDTANWFNDKFLQPLTEKMIGEDGLITKLNASVSSKFKSGVGKGANFLFGTKNEAGERVGGMATPVYNNIMDMTSHINNFFTGKGFKSRTTGKEIKGTENNVLASMKSYMGKTKNFLGKSLFGEKEYSTDSDGNVVLTGKRKNEGLLTRTIDSFRNSLSDFSVTLFGNKSMKDGMGKFYNEKLSQHLPHIASGATLGAILSLITPFGLLGGATLGGGLGFVHSSEKAKDILFGEMGADNKRVGSKFISKEFQEKFKKVAPSVAGLGLLGAGSSILLPGGPLMWSFLGGGLGVAKESENFQKWMFGENHKQRVASMKNNFNKFAPSMMGNAGLGLGASIFLPGGPLMWSFLGAGLGFVKESEKTKEFLFGKSTGDGGYEHFSKEYQEKFKKAGLVSVASYMGASVLQSGLGTLGSFLLPGGPVGAGIVALTAGIVSQSDKFKTFLFGEYDEEKHKREGGLLGKLKTYIQFEILEPLKITLKGYTEKARHWFMTNIANPFKDSLQPLKKQFSIMGQTVKDSIIGSFKQLQFTAGSIFEKYVGKPFGEVLNKHVLNPIKKFTSKLFGGIGKLVGGILSAPVKGLNALAMTFLDKHRRDGVADYYEDWKKNKDSRDKKEKDKYRKNMSTINNMKFNYEDDVLADLRKYGFDPSKPEVKLALARYHNMVKSGKIKEGNQGVNYKGPKKPIEEINQTGFEKVNGTISEILSMLKNIFPFAAKKNNKSGEDKYKTYYHMPKRKNYRNGKTVNSDYDIDDEYDDYSDQDDVSSMSYSIPKDYNKSYKNKRRKHSKEPRASRDKRQRPDYYDIPSYDEPTSATFTEDNSKSIDSISKYTKDIRDEVHGQFDGVGYNIEKVANILTEQFGEPSIMPGLFKGSRGNKKGKGIFGRFKNFLVDLIRKPTDFLKNIFAKPIEKINSFVTGVFSKVGKAVDAVIAIPGKILNIFTNITDIIATAIRPIGEFIMGSIQVGFDVLKFTITEFANSLKGIGKGIGHVFEGLGKVVGSTISTVASFGESMGKIAFDILPRVVHATLDFVSFLGKTAKNTVTAGFRAAQNMFNRHRSSKNADKIARTDIYISGGTLDSVKSAIVEGPKIDKIIDLISAIKKNMNGEGANPIPNGFDRPWSVSGKSPIKPKPDGGGNVLNIDDYRKEKKKPKNDKDKKDVNFMKMQETAKKKELEIKKRDMVQQKVASSSEGTFNILNNTFGKQGLFSKIGTFLLLAFPKFLAWFKDLKSKIASGKWLKSLLDKINPFSKGTGMNVPGLGKGGNSTQVSTPMSLPGGATVTNTTTMAGGIPRGFKNNGRNRNMPQLPPLTANGGQLALPAGGGTPQPTTGNVRPRRGIKIGKGFKAAGKGLGGLALGAGALVAVDAAHNKVNDLQNDEDTGLAENLAYGAIDTTLYGVKQNVKKHAADYSANSIVKYIDKLMGSTACKKVFGKFSSHIGPVRNFLVQRISKMTPDIIKSMGRKISAKLGISLGSGALTAGISTALLYATDLTLGVMETRKIFQVPPESKVTSNMRVMAAIAKFFENNLTFGFIPTNMIAKFLFSLMASDEDKRMLSENQNMMQSQYKDYVASTGDNIDFDTYNYKQNATFVDKAYDGTKKFFGNIGTNVKSAGTAISSGWDSFKKGAGEKASQAYSYVTNGWDNVKTGVKNYALDKTPFVYMNDDKIRKNLGLDKDVKLNTRDRVATMLGQGAENIFGVDGANATKYINGKMISIDDTVSEKMDEARKAINTYADELGKNVDAGIKSTDKNLGEFFGIKDKSGKPIPLSQGFKNDIADLKQDWAELSGDFYSSVDRCSKRMQTLGANLSDRWDKFTQDTSSGLQSVDKRLGTFFGMTDSNGKPTSLSAGLTNPSNGPISELHQNWSAMRTDASKNSQTLSQSLSTFWSDVQKNVGEGAKYVDGLLGSFFGMEDSSGKSLSLSQGVSNGIDKMLDWGKQKVNWISGLFKDDFNSSVGVSNANSSFRNSGSSLGSTSIGSSSSLITSFGDGPGDSAGGSSGDTINGMAYYAQGDPRWGNIAYGSTGNMASSSCGPTSAAMVLSSLSGKAVSPLDAAKYSLAHGHRIPNAGTSWDFFADIGNAYGVPMTTGGTNRDTIVSALKQRRPVILTGNGAPPFTKGGHFIVAAGVSPDGSKIMINDPVSKARSKAYSTDDVLGRIRNSFISSKALSGNINFADGGATQGGNAAAPKDESLTGMFSQFAALTTGLSDSILKGEEFDPNKILEPQGANATGGASTYGGSMGTANLAPGIQNYAGIFKSAGQKYGVEPEIMQAIAMQESGGNPKAGYPNQPAWGLMQIENTLASEFSSFGRQYAGQSFSLQDRIDPAKSIPFATKRFSDDLKHYGNDYLKAIQAYNFSKYSLDMLIKRFGGDWRSHRKEMGSINGVGGSYGDPQYIEHVMRYYKGNAIRGGNGPDEDEMKQIKKEEASANNTKKSFLPSVSSILNGIKSKLTIKPKDTFTQDNIDQYLQNSFRGVTNKISDTLTKERIVDSSMTTLPYEKIIELLAKIVNNTDDISANTGKIAEKEMNVKIEQGKDSSSNTQTSADSSSAKTEQYANNDTDQPFAGMSQNSSQGKISKGYDLARTIALGIR